MGRTWNKGNTPLLLVGVKTCTVTMEINMAIPQKNENQYSSRPSYITLGNIPKECTIIQSYNHVHCSLIHNSQNLEMN